MRTRIVWLTAILVFMGFGLSQGQEVENLLENGGFETGDMTAWSTYGPGTSEVVSELTGAAVPEAPIEGTHALHITIPGPGANFWDAGLQHSGHTFETGKKYTLSAFLKSKSGELQINFKPELGQDPWTGYGSQAFTMTEEWTEFSTTTPVFTSDVNPATITFHIQYDAGDFWVDGVRWYEGDYVPPAFKPVVEAANPIPADGAVNVPQDVILSWEPGPFAAVHDVYFGESFDDVNVAPTMDTLDVLKSNNQPGTTYDPDGLLDFGKTYYWRIDEVNAPPDSTVFRGAVWSFTVEPLAYPITNVTATASSENTADMGPGKTVDGSGINADDEHSVEPTDMWLSSSLPTAPQPTWIQFEFDDVYDLYEMWIWNSNQLLEPVIGFGVQNATLEHSLDGENWTSLGEYEIPRAPGTPDNPHDATISLAGITARFVRLTVNSGWGGILDQFGLAEVRFFFVPVAASDPSPAVRDSGVPLDATLDWRAGREAVKHEVYFSKDEAAVADGTALVDTVEVTNYQPGFLEYGQIYYWKVNEVNEAAAVPVREGEVWEFSTVENFIVEDFESYSAENPIWETWIDGLGFGVPGTPSFNPGNGTGSAVGDDTQPSFTEEIIVNSGRQSMPLFYDNNKAGAANYSETERTFDQPQNWTTGGVSQLSLWFRGHAASVGSFVEGPAGTFTMTGSGADITGPADEFHYAYKMLSGQGSIIARIDSLQNTNDWAKAGVMIRETLDPGSPHATAFVTPANGVVFEYRLTPGDNNVGAPSQQTGITAPHWVKLERSISGAFTVSHSANGSSWQPLGNNASANIQMGTSAYIGLALTSHDASQMCEAIFSNVTTTGNVSGQWINQDIGIASNAPEPLYIGLADSAGNSVTLEHEDPAATQVDTFSVWPVDLAAFADQGVNVASVKKLILGVGNPSAPVAGGSGTMYFDDIAIGNPVQPPEGGPANLLINGGFEDGVMDPWSTYGSATAEVVTQLVGAAVPEDPIEGDSCLHVNVTDVGANFWDVGLQHSGHVLEAGKRYTLSIYMKAKEGTLDVNIKPELAADPWTGYGDQVVTITDQWAEYQVTTPVLDSDVDPASMTFHIGFAVAEFWVDGARLYEGGYVPPSGSANVLVNGGFEDGAMDPWSTYGSATAEVVTQLADAAVPEDPIEGGSCLHVNVTDVGANFWDVGLQHGGHVFEAGKSYTLSVWFKSKSGPFDINIKPERGADPWEGYGAQAVTISDQWAEYSVNTGVIPEAVDPASITFHIGYAPGEFWVDGARFYEGDYVPAN